MVNGRLNRAMARREVEGAAGHLVHEPLASGQGWHVHDVLCTSGRRDRPFEERHGSAALALVVEGTFQYRTPHGRAVMVPGTMLLGNPGEPFECSHEHADGDRCLSFAYEPWLLESVAADAGLPARLARFTRSSLPPVRALSPVAARAVALAARRESLAWGAVALTMLAGALRVSAGLGRSTGPSAADEARVTDVVRSIDGRLDQPLPLDGLARDAGLSPYHFLRTFSRVTGTTPHQYIRRMRLRHAAAMLAVSGPPVIDVALDSGFGDVSNFNRAFRSEFGVAPGRLKVRDEAPPA